jgi:YD repeat-containing protein
VKGAIVQKNIVQKNKYDGAGNLTDVNQYVDAGNLVEDGLHYENTHYSYDHHNRLTQVDNIDGSITKYEYNGLTTKTIEIFGVKTYTTVSTYKATTDDSRLRLVKVTKQIQGEDVQTSTYKYKKDLQIDEVKDSNGNATNYFYDDLARKTSIIQDLDTALKNGATQITNSTEYFANGNIKSVTDGNGHATTYDYNARNLLKKTTDADHQDTLYTYDGAGNLITVKDARENTTTFGYDALNRRNTVKDAKGEVTTTTYDLSGNIKQTEDALHHITKYDYAPLDRQLTITTDKLSDKTIIFYDKLGRVKQQTIEGVNSADDRQTTYTYDDIHNTTTVDRPEGVHEVTTRDSRGNTIKVDRIVSGEHQITRTSYDGLNHPTEIIDALNHTQTFTYDSLGNLITAKQIDAQTGATHTTEYKFNNLGWKTETKDATGRVFKQTYDPVGNVKTQTENGLRTTTNTYDALNRNTQVDTSFGGIVLTTKAGYDAVGNLTSRIDANGFETKYGYDELNRRTLVTDAKHQITATKYDAVGKITSTGTKYDLADTQFINPDDTHQVKYKYDQLNRRTDIIDGEGIDTHTGYNEFGEIKSVTENYTGTDRRTTSYKYDKLGRRIQTIDPLNHATITTYDEASNIRSVTDANSNKTSYDYDRLNRQTKIIDANGITTQITTYDGFGNTRSIKDAGGNETKYEYDNLDRLTTTTDPRKKQTIQDYDGLGRVKSVLDRNHHTKTFAYNINDNLLAETWDDGTVISYTYDKVGNLKTSHDGKSGVDNSYDYDAIYQLTSVGTNNSSVKFQSGYDRFGDRVQRQDLVGTNSNASLNYTYNNNHQLKYLTQSGTGVVTQNIGFGYDKLSQLTQIDRKSANNPGHLITDYAYDSVGRLIDINNQFNTTSISHYGYNYDDGNRLTTKGGTDGSSTVDYGIGC